MLCGLCHIAHAACACAGAGGGASANPNPDQGSRAASGRRRGGWRDGADALREAAHLSEQRSLRFLPARSGGLLFTVKITEHKPGAPPLAVSPPRSRLTVRAISFFHNNAHPALSDHAHSRTQTLGNTCHTHDICGRRQRDLRRGSIRNSCRRPRRRALHGGGKCKRASPPRDAAAREPGAGQPGPDAAGSAISSSW